jgi:mannopine transport system permease protein
MDADLISSQPTRQTRKTRSDLVLLAPAAVVLAIFFCLPLGVLFSISFSGKTAFLGYEKLFASAAAWKVVTNTVMTAGIVTGICVAIAVPFCLALRSMSKTTARLALLATTLPLWISLLVRSYAWLYVLSQEGVANAFASLIGLGPYQLLFNWGAVWLGMVHILLPYMVLPVHNAVSALDPNLTRAAKSLGASDLRILCTVTLPLIARGVATGALLVFVLALGFYVTPQMLGGAQNMMLATYIDVLVNRTLDWPRASAAAVLLTIAVLVCFAILSSVSDRKGGGIVR